MSENIDHPRHYGGADNPYEVIKVLEAWLTREEFTGALKFQIHAYLARARHKGGVAEDYGKASWYTAYLEDYEKRNPTPKSIDIAVTRQLQKSMELNAKMKEAMKEAIRELHKSITADPILVDPEELRGSIKALEEILRMS